MPAGAGRDSGPRTRSPISFPERLRVPDSGKTFCPRRIHQRRREMMFRRWRCARHPLSELEFPVLGPPAPGTARCEEQLPHVTLEGPHLGLLLESACSPLTPLQFAECSGTWPSAEGKALGFRRSSLSTSHLQTVNHLVCIVQQNDSIDMRPRHPQGLISTACCWLISMGSSPSSSASSNASNEASLIRSSAPSSNKPNSVHSAAASALVHSALTSSRRNSAECFASNPNKGTFTPVDSSELPSVLADGESGLLARNSGPRSSASSLNMAPSIAPTCAVSARKRAILSISRAKFCLPVLAASVSVAWRPAATVDVSPASTLSCIAAPECAMLYSRFASCPRASKSFSSTLIFATFAKPPSAWQTSINSSDNRFLSPSSKGMTRFFIPYIETGEFK